MVGFQAAAGFCCITFAMTYMTLLVSSTTDYSEIDEHKEVAPVAAAGRFSTVVRAVLDTIGVVAAAAAVAALG